MFLSLQAVGKENKPPNRPRIQTQQGGKDGKVRTGELGVGVQLNFSLKDPRRTL